MVKTDNDIQLQSLALISVVIQMLIMQLLPFFEWYCIWAFLSLILWVKLDSGFAAECFWEKGSVHTETQSLLCKLFDMLSVYRFLDFYNVLLKFKNNA